MNSKQTQFKINGAPKTFNIILMITNTKEKNKQTPITSKLTIDNNERNNELEISNTSTSYNTNIINNSYNRSNIFSYPSLYNTTDSSNENINNLQKNKKYKTNIKKV